MNMKSFVSFIIVVFVFMMGCATLPGQGQPQRTSAVINGPMEKVWPLLVEEVGSNYPIQTLNKESGLITTQIVNMPVIRENISSFQKYVFSGKSRYEKLRMNMHVTAKESVPGKVSISIIAHYEAYASINYPWRPVPSNGSVENQILTSIEAKFK
jgi:hypothetical protein